MGNILDILKVSASGMKAQRIRMEVIATNLANVHTTRTEEGGPYTKKDVVFSSADVSEGDSFDSVLSKKIEGVKVDNIINSTKHFKESMTRGILMQTKKGM